VRWQECSGEHITRLSSEKAYPPSAIMDRITNDNALVLYRANEFADRKTIYNGIRNAKLFQELMQDPDFSHPIIMPSFNFTDKLKRWWFRNYVRRSDDSEILLGLDDRSQLDLEDTINLESTPEAIPRFAGKLARVVRTEINVKKRDEATELVVREFLLRYMRELGVRKVDVTTILPYAIQLSFIPTRDELLARKLTLMPEYQRRLEDAQPLYSREKPWLFNWFGTKVHEPRASSA
jgi:hypothetical protein